MLSSHLILCHPLLHLPSLFPSMGVSSNESALPIRWSKYWSLSFSFIPSGLISFGIDQFDHLAVQGTLKSLFQNHSLKASILWHSAFLDHSPTLTSVHDYWKNHSFDYIGLCWLCFLIHCLGLSQLSFQRTSALAFHGCITVHSDFEVQENKICHCFHFFPLLFATK